MKILYLTPDMNPKSGWGRYAADLVCGVKANGCATTVLAVEGGARGFLRAVVYARKHIGDFDIIHALDVYPYGVIAYFARIFLSKKIVVTAQGTYAIEPLYGWKTAFLSKLACKSANAVIAISNFTKEELLKKVKLRNIEVINHGVNLALFYTEHLPGDENFILSVGAIKRRKGYHISIPAFALAGKNFPTLKYKIVGSHSDTAYFNELKGLAAKYGVSESVEFLNEVSEVELRGLYQKSQLFVLTSLNIDHNFEGFGLVFLEAAAAGLPVVGTLGNGIEDAVKNDYNGILVRQNDIEATAGAISTILSSNKRRQAMSENSHEWARAHPLEKTVAQYIAAYKSLMN